MLKHLDHEYEVKDECKEYYALTSAHIKYTALKPNIKNAIFVLSNSISEIMLQQGGTSYYISNDSQNLVKTVAKRTHKIPE